MLSFARAAKGGVPKAVERAWEVCVRVCEAVERVEAVVGGMFAGGCMFVCFCGRMDRMCGRLCGRM